MYNEYVISLITALRVLIRAVVQSFKGHRFQVKFAIGERPKGMVRDV